MIFKNQWLKQVVESLPKDEWIKIGRVGKPRGLAGAFFVTGRTEKIPSHYKVVRIGAALESAREAEVLNKHGDSKPFMGCTLASDRDQAKCLIGQWIWVFKADVVVDEQTEYLWNDLIGCEIRDLDQRRLGQALSVTNLGASDILVIGNGERRLELAICDLYFHMEQLGLKDPIQLKVSHELFEEFWYQAGTGGQEKQGL